MIVLLLTERGDSRNQRLEYGQFPNNENNPGREKSV
jgi:hypothetical protein